jgi:hypothetical protein
MREETSLLSESAFCCRKNKSKSTLKQNALFAAGVRGCAIRK